MQARRPGEQYEGLQHTDIQLQRNSQPLVDPDTRSEGRARRAATSKSEAPWICLVTGYTQGIACAFGGCPHRTGMDMAATHDVIISIWSGFSG
jgi:hypothetical protein